MPLTIWPKWLYCGGSPTPLPPLIKKNCEPLVFGPALAIATEPNWYFCFTGSSANL